MLDMVHSAVRLGMQSQENLVIVGSVLLFVKKCGVVINIPQGIKTIGSLDTIGYASGS